jgi:Protein of unknown function (DUF1553)/Protein of unknown function (DUF1549)/Planctomycete cytochrome C
LSGRTVIRVSSFLVVAFCLTCLARSTVDEPEALRITPARRSGSAQQIEFFEAKIRPILAEHCFKCHGTKKLEAGLRLDSREGILRGTDSGPVVVPGHPEKSPLIDAIGHAAAIKMPPKSKLPGEAIDDLTKWVQMGLPWPESRNGPDNGAITAAAPGAKRHWAFQPVANPPPPDVKAKAWLRTSVDRFILSRLEAKGISPSPRAAARTLIRRATFDLLGLPPTPEEVDRFEGDAAPGAFERLIDRLLASPRYGERWGRYWLDVARYADTKGYVLFQDANFHWAYTYRDYVIGAFNRDLPYDRFLIEQIAADRLEPSNGRKPLTALGFLALGGRFMNNVHDVIDDRIDVVCRGLMSLTVTCARCHDHKFDPIPAQDYYSLYGVLASAREPDVPPEAGEPEHTPVYAHFVKELESRQRKLSEFVAAKHREMVEASKRRAPEYLLAAQKAIDQPSTEDFMLLADGTDLNPTMLIRWQVYLARMRKTQDIVFAPWHALASLSGRDFARDSARLIEEYRVGNASATGNGAVPLANPLIMQALATRPPRSLAEAAETYGRLLNRVDQIWQDRVRRAALDGRTPEPLPDPVLESLRQAFYGPDSPPNVVMLPYGDLGLLPDRPSQAKLQELRNSVQNWMTTGPGAPARAVSLEDTPIPFEPYVFLRGNPNNLGPAVPRRFLAAVSTRRREPFREGGGRLELAQAIACRDNPLTARAIVNRIWMHHFGTPLVATPGDFGLRSEPPTHPELLDHLASRFTERGWSIKSLHRRIMLSNTYKQKSDDRSEARTADPENTLYWRANRRRLDFEATRDALLAVSGRLSGRIGGPPMPSLTGTEPRRTIYGFVDRLNLPGIYRTFDFPDPSTSSPRRDQTTVAPQALFLMNHPFTIELSRSILARPDIAALGDTKCKVDRLFRLMYGRTPNKEEFTAIRKFLREPATDPRRWQSLAQGIQMTNEFVFID